MDDDITVRAATTADLPAVGTLAGELVRMHHALNPRRFLLPRKVEEGYRRWFARELKNSDAVLLVAVDRTGTVLGYLYGRFAEHDWQLLLDAHATLDDILVRDDARGRGVGKRLIDAFVGRARERGVPRVVLHTAVANERAQRVFHEAGFQPTMIEMTLDLGGQDHTTNPRDSR